MPSLRRSLIWLVKSVSHDVMWWHDPIYYNQRLTIRIVLSLAQHAVPGLPRSTWCLSNSLASLVLSDKKPLLRAIRHEDYLLLPSHTFRTSSLFRQLTSLVPYILLNMFCPQLGCLLKLALRRRFLAQSSSHFQMCHVRSCYVISIRSQIVPGTFRSPTFIKLSSGISTVIPMLRLMF
jgi:hypothetical protein